MLPPGTRLGAFTIQEAIGKGGMGVVYRALDERTGTLVAVKTLAAPALRERDQRERFVREARSLQRVEHPNITRLLDAGEERGTAYLAFELIDGSSLDRKV